jgi:hypothetical protein
MIKYAKIINQETKECQVGTGTNSKFYQSIGMVEMDVEQAYNGQWYVAGYAPVQPEPTIEEKNEVIRQTRASLYAELIDPLHAQKQRKVVLAEWTEEMEAEYVAQVKALTAKIQAENQYVDNAEVLH